MGVSALGSTGHYASTEEEQLNFCYKILRASLEEAASQLRLKSELQVQNEELWGECGRWREGRAKAAWEKTEPLMDLQVTYAEGAVGVGGVRRGGGYCSAGQQGAWTVLVRPSLRSASGRRSCGFMKCRMRDWKVLCDTSPGSWWPKEDRAGKEDIRAVQEVEPTGVGEGSKESRRPPSFCLGRLMGWGVGSGKKQQRC